MNPKEIIARRIAEEFRDGDLVNLGFGIPTLSANYIPEGIEVVLQTENGGTRFGATPTTETYDPDVANSAGLPITWLTGAASFDMQTSFGMIRGGHVHLTILGALEVSQSGDIANWVIPGVFTPGMGGAMDLLAGAKRVVASLQHTDKDGNSKVLKECTLPLSAKGVVDLIITDLAAFEVREGRLVLIETAPGVSVEEVLEKTEAEVVVSDNVKEMFS